jgi:ferredoxin-NADP reductase
MTNIIQVKIKEIIQRTYNVKSLRVEAGGVVGYKAGQFLRVWLKEEEQFRKYLSISSSPTERGYIEFTKKLTQSDFSKLLDTLKTGDEVKIEYPFGRFTLDDPQERAAFLSGGIGITPIRSISKFACDTRTANDIIILYANRSLKDIAFKDDFEMMQKEFPKLKVVHILSEAQAGWGGRTGYINSRVIQEEIPDYKQRKFYLCGPVGMVETMKKILADELLLPQDSIITENFQGY